MHKGWVSIVCGYALPWLIALVEPDVEPGRVAVIGLDDDIQVAIAIEVGHPGLVVVEACGEQGLGEPSPAVAIKDPGPSARVVRLRGALGPLSHFGAENIEMSILVDIGKLEAMAMHHIFNQKLVTDPDSAAPFEPFERSDAVPRDEDHFGRASLDELPGLSPGREQPIIDQHRLESLSLRVMFEPVAPTDQVKFAIAINIGLGQAFGRPDLGNRK